MYPFAGDDRRLAYSNGAVQISVVGLELADKSLSEIEVFKRDLASHISFLIREDFWVFLSFLSDRSVFMPKVAENAAIAWKIKKQDKNPH